MKKLIITVTIFLIVLATIVAKGQNAKPEKKIPNSIMNWDSISYRETSQMTKRLVLTDSQRNELLKVNLKFFKSIGQLSPANDSASMRRRGEQLMILKQERNTLLTKLLTPSQMIQYNQDMKAAELALKKRMAEMEKKLNTKPK